MTVTTTAAVLRDADARFVMEEIGLPDLGPTDVLVKIVGVGFCHTDVTPRTMAAYVANFNRQFLAEVGSTPSAYRRLEASQKPPNEVISLGLRTARAAEPASGPTEKFV